MPRIRKHHPRRRPEAAHQGRREADARSDAAAVPARRREPRRADLAHRLRHRRQRRRRRRAAQDLEVQRRRAGLAVQSEQAGAEISRERDHAAVPVQRLLPRERGAGGRRRRLQARGRRPDRQQGAVDAGAALRAAAGVADHPPHLRRGLERDRLMAGRAAVGIPAAARRRHAREIRLVPVRRGLFQHHRHGDRAASADPAHLQVRQPDPAAQVRLPDEVPDADQARLQEPEVHHRASTCRTTTPAATGRTRATTGSAGCSKLVGVTPARSAAEHTNSPHEDCIRGCSAVRSCCTGGGTRRLSIPAHQDGSAVGGRWRLRRDRPTQCRR